ncbi:hypothetical protein C1I95_32990 [Micromonospora craterilacus]|uniref:Uncharacterized protein n=1 Tax=Micromonospora craterilacus TaxID=1655439 RepID=A0A2W2DUV9_9ACTN|nr:hypothetical protein [Micromonospora craterilacus]PZG04950.1 hypothetical protein C1I95_32990 [Micromonospora craterilacus]
MSDQTGPPPTTTSEGAADDTADGRAEYVMSRRARIMLLISALCFIASVAYDVNALRWAGLGFLVVGAWWFRRDKRHDDGDD